MMDVDYKAADFWLGVAQWAVMGATVVWTYLRTQDKDNAAALKTVADSLKTLTTTSEAAANGLNLRLTTVEERMRHMPSSDELERLEGDVRQVRARVEGMEDLLKRVEHQTNLIHQHLLTGR